LSIKAKKEGDVDEKEADPITLTLYQPTLKWAIEANNILFGFGHCLSGIAWLGLHQLIHWLFIILKQTKTSFWQV